MSSPRRHRIPRFLALLPLLPLLFSCGDGGTTEPEPAATGRIEVSVTSGGFAVPGVEVSLQGPVTKSGTTDSNGQATFQALQAGTYTVTLSGVPSGVSFQGTSQSVSLTEGGTSSVSFQGTSELTVTVAPDSLELAPEEPAVLTASVTDALGHTVTPSLTWASSNPTVATVDSLGNVLGVAAGQATVTATTGGTVGQAEVWVVATALGDSVVVPDSTGYSLLSDSAEIASGTLRFQSGSGAPELEVGSIVVGTQHGGYLRRVTDVSISGGTVTLKTTQAALAEAVKSGEFRSSVILTPTGPQPVSGDPQFVWGRPRVLRRAEGVSTTSSGVQIDLAWEGEICSQSGTACVNSTISETGSIDFTPSFEVGGKFGWTGLQEFHGEAKGTLGMSLKLSADFDGAVDWESEKSLITYGFPFLTSIGALPVAGEVQVTFVAGVHADLDAQASFETGASASSSLTLGAYYDRDRSPAWISSAEPSLDYTSPIAEWSAAGTSQLRAWVRPEIQVQFYAVAGPSVGAEPYLLFDGSVDLQGWAASLAAGVDADLAFKVEILDWQLADFNHTLEGPRATLWEDEGQWNPPSIKTTSLPDGTLGRTYNETVAATGGKPPYIWSIASGTLPNGLSINSSNGVISGTPPTAGTEDFTIRVTDANGVSDTQGLSIRIANPLTIVTTSLPSGAAGQSYNGILAATGGTMPYTWGVISDTLPSGLFISPSTGVISGTPTAVGTSHFTVMVTDANSLGDVRSLSITITASAPGTYVIGVSASPSSGGSVTGGGSYTAGSSVTVTATAASGYSFTRWTENGAQVSTSASYQFTVTQDRSLVAVFEDNAPTTYTISLSASPNGGGTVTGGGTYTAGTSVTVTASAATGYTFQRWTEGGSEVSTSSAYQFTATRDRSLAAVFEAPPAERVISSQGIGDTWTQSNMAGSSLQYSINSPLSGDLIRISVFLRWTAYSAPSTPGGTVDIDLSLRCYNGPNSSGGQCAGGVGEIHQTRQLAGTSSGEVVTFGFEGVLDLSGRRFTFDPTKYYILAIWNGQCLRNVGNNCLEPQFAIAGTTGDVSPNGIYNGSGLTAPFYEIIGR